MSYLMCWVIQLYWLVPKRWRRSCLFRESCSHHVYRIAREAGGRAALQALHRRYRQCRPGYGLYPTPDGGLWVVLQDGTVVGAAEMREGVIGGNRL